MNLDSEFIVVYQQIPTPNLRIPTQVHTFGFLSALGLSDGDDDGPGTGGGVRVGVGVGVAS